MLKFNNTNIITGYIKNKLHTFNLPQCKVFRSKEAVEEYLSDLETSDNVKTLFVIIKQFKDNRDYIVRVDIGDFIEFTPIDYFYYDREYINITKNLVLTNNIYDTYTHKYLGDYLRFERDYNDVDLMPLYNCYSNQIEEDIEYKYVYLPVIYGKDYTLCLSNLKNVSYILTDKTTILDIKKEFEEKDIQTINNISFKEPYLLTTPKITSVENISKEENLKFVLRLPKTATTSIVCVEGNYKKAAKNYINLEPNFNEEENNNYADVDLNQYISNLSLLNYRYSVSKNSYPFADRLLEYIIDNVITTNDQISNDIIESKYNSYLRYTNLVEKTREKMPTASDEAVWEAAKKSLGRLDGYISNDYKLRFYRSTKENTLMKVNDSDILFNVDKDTEIVLNDKRYPDNFEVISDKLKLIYELSEDKTFYKVIGYKGKGYKAIIPSTYNDLPVREIANNAFAYCSDLKSLAIGENVQIIGANAFDHCINLNSVKLPENVISIGPSAFDTCVKLKQFIVPDTAIYIGENAIRGCSLITTLQLPYVNYVGQLFGASTYEESTTYVPAGLETIKLVGDHITVGEHAFYGCSNVKTLVIGNSCQEIPVGSFEGLETIQELRIPFLGDTDLSTQSLATMFGSTTSYVNTLTTVAIDRGNLADEAFYDCTQLSNLSKPDIITYLGDRAFYNCSSLSGELEFTNLTYLGSQVFYNCSNLTAISLEGDDIEEVSSGLVYGCSNLETLVLPALCSNETDTASADTLFGHIFGTTSFTGSVAVEQVFSNDVADVITYYIPSTLRSVTIKNGNILYGTFTNCSMLENIYIEGYNTELMGFKSLYGCSNLQELTIPFIGLDPTDTTPSTSTLFGCLFGDGNSQYPGSIRIRQNFGTGSSDYGYFWIPNNLTTLKIMSLTPMLFGGLSNCTLLTSIVIGGFTTSITGIRGFENCTAAITWENHPQDSTPSITTIGDNVFMYYMGSSLTIPSTITNLGNNVFSGCSNLTSITFENNSHLLNIGQNAFNDCSSLISITIPKSVTTIGGYTFNSCANLEHIFFEENSSLTTIPYLFLQYNTKVESITLPNSITIIGSSAFFNSTGLTSINIPNNVQTIGANAFKGCSNLSTVTGIGQITDIGQDAFNGCSSLQSINLSLELTSIGVNAFLGCTSLSAVYYEGNIEDWALISFASRYSNPLACGHNLYIDNELVDELTVPTNTTIGEFTYNGISCSSITIPYFNSIPEGAF